ncbi:hypothetical protein BDZ89DRAFT_1144339 [Hymenopellis radicata]|nr:hypothetical protein BDZ89DRAFT_1144339 [Hymenopellis radicata]
MDFISKRETTIQALAYLFGLINSPSPSVFLAVALVAFLDLALIPALWPGKVLSTVHVRLEITRAHLDDEANRRRNADMYAISASGLQRLEIISDRARRLLDQHRVLFHPTRLHCYIPAAYTLCRESILQSSIANKFNPSPTNEQASLGDWGLNVTLELGGYAMVLGDTDFHTLAWPNFTLTLAWAPFTSPNYARAAKTNRATVVKCTFHDATYDADILFVNNSHAAAAHVVEYRDVVTSFWGKEGFFFPCWERILDDFASVVGIPNTQIGS